MGWSTHAAGTDDPPEVRNRRIHFTALVVSMSALAMGYDTAVIGGTMALDSFRRRYGFDAVSTTDRDTIQGNIVSTFHAGCFFGALLTFPLAERLGRKKAVMLASLVFLLGGTLKTVSAGHLTILYVGRVIAGLGIGASSLIAPVYIAETAPPSIRGRLVGIYEIASQGGGMLGFWINYAADQAIGDRYQAQWILPLATQLVPGVLLFLGMLWCPESPRWLAKRDDFDAAEAVLTKLRNLPSTHAHVRHELAGMRVEVERRGAHRLGCRARFQKLFQKGTRNRVAIGMALMFLQSFTGVNIVTYYAPRIFETLGVPSTSLKLFSTGFYGIAKTLGVMACTVLVVEKVGRRNGLVWGAALGCLPMWYIGAYVMRANPGAAAAAAADGQTSRDGWGYLAMVCIYVHAFVSCATWQGITWTYASEIFPLDVRMLCVALTTACTWLGAFTIARSTPYMITDLGYGAYFTYAAVLVGMGVWAFVFVPETKGMELEKMDSLFSRPTHRVVWAQLTGRPILVAETPRAGSGLSDGKETVGGLGATETVKIGSRDGSPQSGASNPITP